MKALNLTGFKIGKLTVLYLSDLKKEYNSKRNGKVKFRLWVCLCECGKNVLLTPSQLRCGHIKSCGCSLLEYRSINARKEEGFASKTQIFLSYQHGAKSRNLSWELSKEIFIELTQKICFYCGNLPNNVSKRKSGDFIYNGIDRIDNTLGYLINNVVPCCKICNRAKLEMSKDEFLSFIERVYKYHILNKGDI
ncbi:MAG: hypothetical protein AAB973_01010 [Patescibacteria group bacterium]